MDSTTEAVVRRYLERADEKLVVARNLFTAFHLDDAVSRAYYSAFNAVKALLAATGQNPKSHHGTAVLFNRLFVKTGKFSPEIGRFLTNLRDDRESADYDVFSNVDPQAAEEAIREAVRLVDEVKEYLHREGFLD